MGVAPELRLALLDARELELARLPDGSVVAKRGVREILLSDPAAGGVLEELAELLDGTRSAEEMLATVAPERRGQAAQLLSVLISRQLLDGPAADDTAEAKFWRTFGARGESAPAQLLAARVTVLGSGAVARGLVAQLAACGVGAIDVVGEHGDDDRDEDLRVRRVDAANALGSVAGCTLLCATSDTGLGRALSDANREALAAGVPFLAAWVADLVGYVGPLTEPFDTACLRCYQIRLESNSDHPETVRALREHREREGGAPPRDATGLLPPMANAVSAVAAMEAVKRISGFAPSDATGRLIELNLVSFASRVRRVLKLPRCPDCSDTMRRHGVALARGPQVPGRE